MGQQQLLLIVLSTIIVGVAVVVGFNMFSSSAAQANQDAVAQEVMTLGGRAMEWMRKPAQMGGGGGDFLGIDLNALGYPDPYVNANGTFTITSNAGAATISATGTELTPGGTDTLTVQGVWSITGLPVAGLVFSTP